jgi:predicted nucleic acid-binding protein
MMMAYVDTNVILAKYVPTDKLSRRATAFLDQSRNRKIVSPVSVIELAAVISRIDSKMQAPQELLQEPPKRRVRTLVEYMIRDSGFFLASVPAQARIKVAGVVLSVPIEYHSCIRLAHALKLKTLDLLHLAYADGLRKWGHDIDTFATFDVDMLERSSAIHDELGIEIKEP